MVMPFKPHYFNLFEYGYAHVCRSLGLDIQTVLDDLQPGPIPEKILKKIDESDIILVDATELNANVFFEAGYATGLGKTVIYAVEDVERLPFDTKADLHLVHQGKVSVIRDELPGYLASAIEHVGGRNLLDNPHLKVNPKGWSLRSSRRPKRECLLAPPPAIDTSLMLGQGHAMRIRREQHEETPLEGAVSVLEFTHYALRAEGPPDAIPLEQFAGREVTARCTAFVQNDGARLQHRWRALLCKSVKPREYSAHVWGSITTLDASDDWGLLEDRLVIPADVGEARFLRFAIETTGGEGPATYWISRPAVTLDPDPFS